MDQLLFLFQFFPDMLWHILLIVSGLLTFLTIGFSFVPYRVPVGALASLLFAMSIWMEGAISNEAKWQAELDAMRIALSEAEKKATQKNVEIQEKVVYKDKIIKEKGAAQIQYIDRIVQGDTIKETVVKDMTPEQRAEFEKKVAELQTSIKNCPVPKIVIEEHNKAAIRAINDAAKGEKK
jgi:hypothetical protein